MQYDEFGGEKRCATRIGGVSDMVGKGSADGDGGVQNGLEGRKSRPRSADRD